MTKHTSIGRSANKYAFARGALGPSAVQCMLPPLPRTCPLQQNVTIHPKNNFIALDPLSSFLGFSIIKGRFPKRVQSFKHYSSFNLLRAAEQKRDRVTRGSQYTIFIVTLIKTNFVWLPPSFSNVCFFSYS